MFVSVRALRVKIYIFYKNIFILNAKREENLWGSWGSDMGGDDLMEEP